MARTRPVLVASSPGGPVQDVPGIPSGGGEYQRPEQAQEFVAGERGHPGLVGAALLAQGVLACGGDGQEGVGNQRGGAPAVPAGPGGDLALVQACGALAGLEVLFDGLITNGKFCCVRQVRLSLTWWHRPLRLRGSALHTDVALVGEPDDPDLDRLPPVHPAPGRRAPVGSGLPAAGASGRAGRPARPDADRRGGR